MGLRHLHQLLALPRDSLARRFPAEVLAQLDTLLGHRPLPLEFYRPPDVFDTRIELNFEVESHRALLFPLRRLTADRPPFSPGGTAASSVSVCTRNIAPCPTARCRSACSVPNASPPCCSN